MDEQPVHDAPIGPSQIFKATYSGVPVYEMICKGVAVMRRRSDSYLNATQILKVADFDKPQRTRILEREVQKGEHEKVQGGYGKYQGTWVPYERGLQLCQEYNVVHLLQPILEYQATKTSPPLAPKHITAASNRPRKPREPREPRPAGLTPSRTPSPGRSHDDFSSEDTSDKESHSSYSSDSPPTSPSARAQNLSPNSRKKHRRPGDELFLGNENHLQSTPQRKRRTRQRERTLDGDMDGGSSQAEDDGNDGRPHAETLLEYFISDTPGFPRVLTHPPSDLDVNVVIDDEGHTALHWAAAMAKPDVIKLLVRLGADTYRVNTDGQTALMRSVLFSNNFDQKEFVTLLDLLQKTIFTIDKDDQTVFHQVAITAGQRGKIHAARYYLECLLAKLVNHPSELASIINVQDRVGDTALTIAARLKVGGKKVVKMLLDAGADPKIRNHTGKNAEDYVLETEQAITSAVASTTAAAAAAAAAAGTNKAASTNSKSGLPSLLPPKDVPTANGHQSLTTSTRNVVIPTVSDLFGQLTHSYEKDIFEKDQDIVEARNLLQGIQAEIWEGRRTIQGLKATASTLQKAERDILELEKKIMREIQLRQRLRLEELVKEREEELRSKSQEGTGTSSTASALGPSEHDVNGADTTMDAPNSSADMEMMAPPTSSSTAETLEPSNHPNKVELLENEEDTLRRKLEELQKNRKERVEEMVQWKSQQDQRRCEYQRLIALCCNVSMDQVDGLLQPLLNSLGGEDDV
ncbi:MAG: apses-domain-containing protein [Linnemannia gamsii]|nr:MAG: apses-domain-containing protein [Linnemannia gamsii]